MRQSLVISAVVIGLMASAPAWSAGATGGGQPPAQPAVQAPAQGQTQDQAKGAGKPHRERGEMFRKADKDGDGAVSKAEFLAQAEERFAKMDKNGDGKLTKEDRPQRPEGGKSCEQGGCPMMDGDMPMKGMSKDMPHDMPMHDGMMQQKPAQ